jgi:hypothetical protein
MYCYGAWSLGVLIILEARGLAIAQTGPVQEPVAVVEVGGEWGFLTRKGTYVFNRQFDGLGWFSEGLAAVKVDGKWGFMDGLGTIVIAPQFDGASGFSEGLAGVTLAGKEGFIDKSGQVVITPRFDHAWPFSNGLALIEIDHKRGYIDQRGTMVIEPENIWAFPFSDGVAYVVRDGKAKFIDKSGKPVTDFQIDEGAEAFYEGVAAVRMGQLWGFIDVHGAVVIPPKYDGVFRFSGGLAKVADSQHPRQWFAIDKSGRVVIGPRFHHTMGCEGAWFSEGLMAQWADRKRCGFIDRSGRLVIRTKLDAFGTIVGDFHQGMVQFLGVTGKYGFLNRSGRVAIQPQFDFVTDFALPDPDSNSHW